MLSPIGLGQVIENQLTKYQIFLKQNANLTLLIWSLEILVHT
jgi:hypothetical protein